MNTFFFLKECGSSGDYQEEGSMGVWLITVSKKRALHHNPWPLRCLSGAQIRFLVWSLDSG